VEQGAELVEVELPHVASSIAAYYVIAPCEAFSNLARFDGVRYGYQEPGMRDARRADVALARPRLWRGGQAPPALGAYLLSSGVYERYYYPAQQVRTLITQDYERAWERCDVILMPASPRTAFKLGEISDPTQMYASDLFTISANIAGNGAVSVPLGLGDATHLPVSAQLQGPAFKDRMLLTFARAIERAFDAQGLVAPDFAGRGGELR
jgi:aspartyl-tRNA(Asn)/glutamyl-tRNA(Gln) amidotransferase subunit A